MWNKKKSISCQWKGKPSLSITGHTTAHIITVIDTAKWSNSRCNTYAYEYGCSYAYDVLYMLFDHLACVEIYRYSW